MTLIIIEIGTHAKSSRSSFGGSILNFFDNCQQIKMYLNTVALQSIFLWKTISIDLGTSIKAHYREIENEREE